MSSAGHTASSHQIRDQALFDRIAESYARKDVAPSSRRARRQRLERTLNGLLNDGAEVLEAGCGAGFSVQYLPRRVALYHGIDYSENLIDYARRHNARTGATFEAANIKEYNPGRQFDVVFMIGVLHHLDDMPAALRNILSWLKPGGCFVANEPQSGNPLVRWARRCRTRVDRDYSDDQEQLSTEQLRMMYESAGFVDVRIRPQGILSTPFAEVVMQPQWLMRQLSAATCATDTALESVFGRALKHVAWNLIAAGRRPQGGPS